MSVEEVTKTEKTYKCDFCGKTSAAVTIGEWYTFSLSIKPRLLLMEGEKANSYFETYNLPKSLVETYCCLACAKQKLIKDIDLFLASVKPSRGRQRARH